jgi:hypothetical protein
MLINADPTSLMLRSRVRATILPIAALLAAAIAVASCEGDSAHFTGPKGETAFGHYIAIGTGLSMGVQSGGVIYESQLQSWPAVIAHAAGAGFSFVVTDTVVSGANSFSMPMFRTPGCQPPLIAPLQLAVDLSGAGIATADSSCAGLADTLTPPRNNLALPGATAWAALNLTPKIVLNATIPYGAGDRARYPLVLGSTQSQVTALRVEGASIVSVELGLSEVLGAATTGLLIPATSYTQTTPFTYVPAAVFAPVFAAIADSVKLTGAKVVLLSVPKVTSLYALRPASELWNDRAELATFGVNVTADCGTSANFVFTGVLIPSLAANYASTGMPQNLSCTDVPGTADAILTAADISALDATVTQMNTQIQQIAQQNGWAFADLTGVFPPPVSARSPYAASDQLTCVYPYGQYVSLDGVFPNAAGQAAIASTVANAIDAKFGFAITVGATSPSGITAAKLCP